MSDDQDSSPTLPATPQAKSTPPLTGACLVPTVKTLVTVPGVYASLRAAWRVQMGCEAPRAALLCLLAQWALETGRGQSCYCYNLGNVRHSPGDGRDWCQLPRVSEVLNGVEHWYVPPDPMTNFRAFASLDEGSADYLATVRTNFPTTWPALVAGDPHAYVKACAAAHYFTATEGPYERTLSALFAEFDREIPSDPAQPAGVAITHVDDAGGEPTPPGDPPPAVA